jgi:UDP-GlcNAc:undecaprenyl-phosphate GlcNAc-1-phosphate transferase
MMTVGKLHLSSLGYILVLGAGARPFGFFLTLFAVWAAINAFNMVDGIDGLLGVVIRLVCRNRHHFVV